MPDSGDEPFRTLPEVTRVAVTGEFGVYLVELQEPGAEPRSTLFTVSADGQLASPDWDVFSYWPGDATSVRSVVRKVLDFHRSLTDTGDLQPPHRYSVSLRSLSGEVTTYKVVTNRGESKAAFLAGRASTGLLGFGGRDALDVDVVNEGLADVDADGVVELRGFIIDRDEW